MHSYGTMRHFTSINDIPIFQGNDFLFYWGRDMAFASKVLICPKCLISQIFVKNSEDDMYHYDAAHDPDPENGKKIGITSDVEFYDHIQKCKTCFPKDGINNATSDKLISLAEKMNSISIMETGYCRINIQKSTFFYVVDGLPASYIAFDPAFTSSDFPSRWILKDMYTIPKYRNMGYMSKLFEHATKKLKLDLGDLWISFPISDLGKNIVLKYATDKISAVAWVYPRSYNVSELEKEWDDIMKIY